MTANHYICKLSSDPEDDLWCLFTCSESGISEQTNKLGALARELNKLPVVALMSAAGIRVVKAHIPGRSESQVKQAAPYVIEEDLANDVDDLVIQVSKIDNDEQRAITIYEAAAVESFCNHLNAAGIEISSVIPDASLIDAKPRCLTAIQSDGRVLLAYQQGLFAAVDDELFPALLSRLVRDADLIEVLIVTTQQTSATSGYNDSLKQDILRQYPDLILHIKDTKDSVARYIISQHRAVPSKEFQIDLLPESARENGKFGISNNRTYLLAAGIAFLALLGHIGFSWSDNQAKAVELATLKAQQEEIFSNAFPEITRVVNAEAQAKQRLKELKEQGPPPAEFLGVLYASTEILDRSNPQELQLAGFSFADGVLLLRTESKDMAVLEKYRSELSGFLSAEVVNAESGDDGVRGAIRVRSRQ